MIYLRSVLFNIFSFCWTYFLAIVLIPLLFLDHKHTLLAGKMWGYGITSGARWLVGIKMEIRGREHIPTGSAIIASKHQSEWETAAFYILLPMPVFVLKQELTKIPLFGRYVKGMKNIAIDRSASMQALKQMIEETKERFEEGRQVIIFPEGTRIKAGDKEDYQHGVAMIYTKANLPVIPVALNSGILWPRDSYVKHPGTIVIEFLPPIQPGLDRKAFMQILEERIESKTMELVEEVRAHHSVIPDVRET